MACVSRCQSRSSWNHRSVPPTELAPLVSVLPTKRHVCPDCSKSYSNLGGLKQHRDHKHPEPGAKPKYECEHCHKTHANSSNLKRHLLSCGPNKITPAEGQYVCNECGFTAKQKGGVKQHKCKGARRQRIGDAEEEEELRRTLAISQAEADEKATTRWTIVLERTK